MRALAAKQKPTQEANPAASTRTSRAFSRQGCEQSLISDSNRSTGHEIVEQPMQAHKNESESLTSPSPSFCHDFGRIAVCADPQTTMQPKLRVNTPGNAHELEADQIAEQVMRMPDPQLQRACSCNGGCLGPQNNQAASERLQTKRAQANDNGDISVPHNINEVLTSSGQPLDPSTRAFMELRFGHDFSNVQVHTDARAAESATASRAQAYTVGQHIAFGAGQYRPHLKEGRQLLAHELTHTIQQLANTKLDAAVRLQFNDIERRAQATFCRHESYSSRHLGSLTFLPVLQRQALTDDAPLVKTKKPTARATMLLQMFWNGVTNTGLSFTPCSQSDFNTASHDGDAMVDTIQAIKNSTNVTYTFINSSKTGFVFVCEKQEGTHTATYYKSGEARKKDTDITSDDVDQTAAKHSSKAAPGSREQDAPVKVPPSSDEKRANEKARAKSDKRIGKINLPGAWIGGADQTWLPGADHHGKPLQQGDLTQDLENALLKLVRQIKNSSLIPKELQIAVTLFRTDLPTPGYRYAAENLGTNIKNFLEQRLPKAIKINETHKFVDIGKTSSFGSKQQLHTIMPVY